MNDGRTIAGWESLLAPTDYRPTVAPWSLRLPMAVVHYPSGNYAILMPSEHVTRLRDVFRWMRKPATGSLYSWADACEDYARLLDTIGADAIDALLGTAEGQAYVDAVGALPWP